MPRQAELPFTVSPGYLLPDSVPADNYLITNLKDIASWKARILIGNSAKETQNLGDWNEVGYVMISLTGPTKFIPIARADEHNCGYDLLRKKTRAWKITASEWQAIFPNGPAGIYLYDAKVDDELLACRRWLEAGGPPFQVRSIKQGQNDGWITDCEDFIKQNGKVRPLKNGLLKPGDQLIRVLDRLTKIFNLNRSPDSRKPDEFSDAVQKLLPPALNQLESLLHKYFYFTVAVSEGFKKSDAFPPMPPQWMEAFNAEDIYFEGKIRVWREFCDQALMIGDIAAVERTITSHFSIKNSIHQAVRHEMLPKSCSDNMKLLFGDLDVADRLLALIDRSPHEQPSNGLSMSGF